MKYTTILTSIIISAFCTHVLAQQTGTGKTFGKKETTNFNVVANYEKANQGKVLKVQLPPDESLEDEEANKISSLNNVGPDVPAFNGKLTIVSQKEKENLDQVQEFPCNNFRALDDDGTSSPPDVNGAVGFDHLMTTLNTQVSIQNKQGDSISTTSLLGFWNGLGGHADIFDPKITYDPYDKRWFFVCCADRSSTTSSLLLAVSQTPDPTGGWITYTIKADPGNKLWFDYPSLGFNRNWITVGGFLFKIPGAVGAADTVARSRIWVIDKSVVYAGNPNITVTYFDRTDYFHISPAITYDPTTSTQWLAGILNSNFSNEGYYKLFSLTGTQAAPVFNEGSTVDVGTAWNKRGVNGMQLGSSTGLDLGDDRILQTTFRGGTLWVGNNIFLPAVNPTTCAAQVVAINTVTGTSIENIRTAANTDGSVMQAYPSISVNANNDIFFGYSTFRNNAYVTSTISYRRNGQGFFFYYYKPGEDWYVKVANGKNRWGDYSATFIDPEDDITAWTVQEYARPRVLGVSFWGTWWAKICPGTCSTNLSFGSSYSNIMKKYEANNIITSSAQVISNSFIKYDAGVQIHLLPGFRVLQGNKFQAYVEGCGGIR